MRRRCSSEWVRVVCPMPRSLWEWLKRHAVDKNVSVRKIHNDILLDRWAVVSQQEWEESSFREEFFPDD
jgi:hypothetical protein